MAAAFHASAINEINAITANTVALTISAGDSIAVVGAWEVTAPTPTIKITDNTTLTLIVGPTTDIFGNEKYGVWLLQSAASGNSDFTITFGTAPAYSGFYAWSFSGLASPVLDQSGVGSLNSNVTTAALTSSDEFAVEFAVANGAISAIGGAPWTSDGISTNNSWGGGHQVAAATTALTSTFTGETDAFIFTFKAGAAASNTPYNPWPQAAPLLAQ